MDWHAPVLFGRLPSQRRSRSMVVYIQTERSDTSTLREREKSRGSGWPRLPTDFSGVFEAKPPDRNSTAKSARFFPAAERNRKNRLDIEIRRH